MNTKIVFLFAFFIISTLNAQILFNWDTSPINNVDTITETIDGITTTFIKPTISAGLLDANGFGGSSGNIVYSSTSAEPLVTSITFEFSEAVNVISVLAMEGEFRNIDYTFTPFGGSNSPVVASLVNGVSQVSLNWVNVTSFVVSSEGSHFAFDNLEINRTTLSIIDHTTADIHTFPNPVRDFLYIRNTKNPISIEIYNNLGQLILETKEEEIDFRNLNKGVYFLKATTANTIKTKRIIKN